MAPEAHPRNRPPGWIYPSGVLPEGVEWASVLGCPVPEDYGDWETEYRSLRNEAVVLPAPWERSVRVSGPDSRRFLHNLLTQEVESLPPDRCQPAALADRRGHLVCDLWLWSVADQEFRLRIQEDRLAPFLEALDHYRIMERVEWAEDPKPVATFLLLGPGSGRLLSQLGGEREGREAGWLTLDGGGFWMRVRETGPTNFFVAVPADDAPRLWSRLGGLGAPVVGWRAFDLARIENGRAWCGIDTDGERLIPEAGLEDRVSYQKGCFLGQETLGRLHSRGDLKWRIHRIELEGTAVPAPGTPLLDPSGKKAGWITSGALHPDRGLLALGYVHRRQADDRLALALPDGSPVRFAGVPSP